VMDRSWHSRIHVDVSINAALWNDERQWVPTIERAVIAACDVAGFRPSSGEVEVSVLLTCDAVSQKLNMDFRGKDKPTNVLSFPCDDPCPDEQRQQEGIPLLLGDIVIAGETVAREAIDSNKSMCDHVAFLVVHGVLHLLGYDHQEEHEADHMEQMERSVLATLGDVDLLEESSS